MKIWQNLMRMQKKLVVEGKISEDFPLYYSWYNYKTGEYEKDDLNTAEAMVTLLHLAEAGLLKDDTAQWLKSQMDREGIKARYTVSGEVVDGYNYDSTAVYALVAMIAEKIGDKDLQGKALKKMEKMRIVKHFLFLQWGLWNERRERHHLL